MAFEDTMDQFRDAFDIHGEIVECVDCGLKMDILTVQHWTEDHEPLCDRSFWSRQLEDEDPDYPHGEGE